MTNVALGTLFNFIRNGLNVKQDKSGNGLPITRIETISDGTIDRGRVGYAGLREEDANGWLLEEGDILLSHINSVAHIGKCAIYRGEPSQLIHGMNLLCFRSDRSKLDPEFAKYLLRSAQFRSHLSNCIKEAVNQASVSIGDMQAIPVSVPPLPEQRRIAAILDKADELRAKRRAAIAKFDSLTRSIFLDMFGDPVTNSKGWSVAPLGTFLRDVTNGMTRRRAVSDQGQSIVLRLRDIREGWIDFSDVNRITLTADEAKKYQVLEDDLLFIRVNGNPDYVGRCALFRGYIENVYFNDHVMRVRVDGKVVHGVFLASLLNSAHGKREIAKHRKTSAGQHTINQDGLSRIKLLHPPLHMQQHFANVITAIGSWKKTHEISLLASDRLFASLQHRAFRGEL